MNSILSTIDLGTNTVLMVTGEILPSGDIRILGDEHDVGRLGKGVDANGLIQPETFDRIAAILKRYRDIAEGLGAGQVTGYGTSALRDARNREEFIAAMKERAGVKFQLLSGQDEARLTWRGALFGLTLKSPPTEKIVVLDIGGGSTEIAIGSNGMFEGGVSVDVGAVRITERFFGGEFPPAGSAVDSARDFTREAFAGTIVLPADPTVVGVAGTVTTFGAMVAGIERFDADAINGIRLEREWIRETTKRLLASTTEEIRSIPQVVKGREDILPGGGLVLDEFMEAFDVREIIVSTRGLRYGLLENETQKNEV